MRARGARTGTGRKEGNEAHEGGETETRGGDGGRKSARGARHGVPGEERERGERPFNRPFNGGRGSMRLRGGGDQRREEAEGECVAARTAAWGREEHEARGRARDGEEAEASGTEETRGRREREGNGVHTAREPMREAARQRERGEEAEGEGVAARVAAWVLEEHEAQGKARDGEEAEASGTEETRGRREMGRWGVQSTAGEPMREATRQNAGRPGCELESECGNCSSVQAGSS